MKTKQKYKLTEEHKKKIQEKRGCHFYTQEQIDYIYDNYKKYYTPQLVEEFNKKFNTNISISSLNHIKQRYKLKSGNHRTNLGKKASEETKLKMIETRKKYTKPIGYITLMDGRPVIKYTNSQKGWSNYMSLAKYVYEQKHGKISNRDIIMRLDGNIHNNEIDNLIVVPKRQFIYMVERDLYFKNKELNKTSIMATDLLFKTINKKKEVI